MEKQKRQGGTLTTVLLLLILLAGLGIFFYPRISEQLNKYRQANIVTDYVKAAASIDSEENSRMLEEADAYNRRLAERPGLIALTEAEKKEYEAVLDINGTGVMGYIEIPRIQVKLPIYHGTSDKVLQDAIGHIEGSSLPVGGGSTHSLISGHRGLPSARLFTDIDQLEEGDRFTICVLDRNLTYAVDQIKVILPDELGDLKIEPGKDLCTLITCTPYGVNTHRLLVRGTRVPDTDTEEAPPEPVSVKLDPMLLIPLTAAPFLLILILVLIIRARRKKNGPAEKE